MPRTLSRFTVSRSGDGYQLRIEAEGGDALEVSATFDQLDLIAEQIDALLDDDEDDALGVDEEQD